MKSTMKGPTVRTPGQRARIARVIAAVALAGVFTAACSGSTDVRTTTSLTIAPTTATVAVNGTQQFTAVAKASNGSVLNVTPTWSVVAGGGTITQTGLFTAGTTAGTFTNTVSVTCSGITSTATVIVTAGALATITVTPNPATLTPGAVQTFTAVGKDAAGNVVAITPAWSVVAGGGSIVAGTGVFTAGGPTGTFTNTVKATSGTISGTATVIVNTGSLVTITVSPNPATVQVNTTQQFTAVGRDAGGNVVAITPVWTVTNGGGSIDPSTGLFTAGGTTGTFSNTVRATSGAVFGTATVIVTLNPPPGPPAPIVNLGAAAPNGIMAGTAVTCITGGIVNADISISPGNTLTGFGPCVATGVLHLADAVAAQAQIDLTNAYNTLMGLPCPPANAIVADLGGTTKPAGVYCTATGIGVTGVLTLDGGGDPNAVFVFQAGSSLTTAGDVVLINSAQAKNVYWVVGSSATIGTASQWQGNVIALTSITLVDNATLTGRALARNGAVTLGTNNVITLP
jgi:hypothetical protein